VILQTTLHYDRIVAMIAE